MNFSSAAVRAFSFSIAMMLLVLAAPQTAHAEPAVGKLIGESVVVEGGKRINVTGEACTVEAGMNADTTQVLVKVLSKKLQGGGNAYQYFLRTADFKKRFFVPTYETNETEKTIALKYTRDEPFRYVISELDYGVDYVATKGKVMVRDEIYLIHDSLIDDAKVADFVRENSWRLRRENFERMTKLNSKVIFEFDGSNIQSFQLWLDQFITGSYNTTPGGDTHLFANLHCEFANGK